LRIDDVGVRGVMRGVIVDGLPATATIDVSVALPPTQRGAHMSRFHEAIDAVLDPGGLLQPARGSRLEELALDIARTTAHLQEVDTATAHVTATLVVPTVTDVGASWEPVTVRAAARWSPTLSDCRQVLEVTVTGITACPCAQALVAAAARERLAATSLDDRQIDEALAAIPVATHNQRGTATIALGWNDAAAPVTFTALTDIARAAMSSRTSELLKRAGELAVVEAAHAHPRFVEDCTRLMLDSIAAMPEANDDLVVWVRQVNHESIHAHDVEAARSSTVGSLRAELGHAISESDPVAAAWATWL
jgi:MptA/FolE2 family GTP cyclohydrolase